MESLIEYNFIAGARKNSKLLCLTNEKQIFIFKVHWMNKEKKIIKKYNCYEKDCPASVQLIEEDNHCILSKEQHSHITNQEETIKKFKVMNSIKTEVAQPNLKRNRIRNIFDEETLNENRIDVPYNQMKRHLRRIKAGVMPKPPITPQDFIEIFRNEQYMNAFGMCESKQDIQFYQTTVIEEKFSYTIFFSPPIGDLILQNIPSEHRNYLIDATFSVVPKGNYKQLLIVALAQEKHVFPFLFALMSNKSMEIYEHLFAFIDTNIICMKPSILTTDYEKSLRNALHKVFPKTKINGCWFHFCQALRRKALKLPKLKNMIRNDNDAKRILKKLMSLPLLPPQEIVAGFNICKSNAYSHLKFQIEDKNIFDEFFTYYEMQWINKETPQNITVFDEFIRTTSALEGYNSFLSAQIPKHGSFWDFLNLLRKDENKQYNELKLSIDGAFNVFERPRKCNKNKSYLIQSLTNKLIMKSITVSTFLQAMTNNDNDIIKNNFDEKIDETFSEGDENEKEEENTKEKSYLCEICFNTEKNTILKPCMHGKICDGCFKEIEQNHVKNKTLTLCPFCRQIVKSSEQFFL